MEEVYIIVIGDLDWEGDYTEEIHSVFANERKAFEKVEELRQSNEFAQVCAIKVRVKDDKN